MRTQIDQLDRGQRASGYALRYAHQLVASASRVGVGLGGRRRRTKDDRAAAQAGEDHGEVTGVITDALLLLVSRVMFLVHDDQSEVLNRSEDGRAWSDDNAAAAVDRGHPGGPAFGHVLGAVKDRGEAAKAMLKGLHHLIG